MQIEAIQKPGGCTPPARGPRTTGIHQQQPPSHNPVKIPDANVENSSMEGEGVFLEIVSIHSVLTT